MDLEPSADEQGRAALARAFAEEHGPTPAGGALDPGAVVRALGARGLLTAGSVLGAALATTQLAEASAEHALVLSTAWLVASALARATGPAAAAATDAAAGTTVTCAALADPLALREPGVVDGVTGPLPAATAATGLLAWAASVAPSDAVVFLIPLGGPEASVSPRAATVGLDALPFARVTLARARLEPRSVLAEGAAARSLARSLADTSRVLVAAAAVGVARRALSLAQASVGGASRRLPQLTQFTLADMATEVDAAALSVTQAAWLLGRPGAGSLESAAAKLVAGRAATRVAHAALSVAEGDTLTAALRRAYLDARLLELHEGGAAAQTRTIASELLAD